MTPASIALHVLWGASALGAAAWLAMRAAPHGGGATAGAPAGPARGRWLVALLIGTGWLAGHTARLGLPEWGADAHQPFWIGLAALVAAVALELVPRGRRGAAVLAATVVALVFAAITAVPGTALEWRDAVVVRWSASLGFVAAGFAVCFGAVREGARAAGPSWPARLLVVSGAVAATALLSAYAKFTESTAVLGAVLLPSAVVLAVKRRGFLGPGASLIAGAVLWTVLTGTFLHTLASDRAPASTFLLVGFALMAAPTHGPSSCCGPRTRGLARWAAVLALIAAGLATAFLQDEGSGTDDALEEEWGEYYEDL